MCILFAFHMNVYCVFHEQDQCSELDQWARREKQSKQDAEVEWREAERVLIQHKAGEMVHNQLRQKVLGYNFHAHK